MGNDIIGKKFGRLTAIRVCGSTKNRHRLIECRCDCGNKKVVVSSYLTTSRTRSCGCIRRETTVAKNTTHGLSNSRTHKSWMNMKTRCYNKNAAAYRHYGGRGIRVCERWHTFENFCADMGNRPGGMGIDRIDNNGNYEPGNCRWATISQQSRNRRSTRIIEIDGERLCVEEWGQKLGVNPQLIRSRLHRGWAEKEAVLKP